MPYAGVKKMSRPAKRFYEFDSFRIDVEERRLLRDYEPVPLTPKVFDILLALSSRPYLSALQRYRAALDGSFVGHRGCLLGVSRGRQDI